MKERQHSLKAVPPGSQSAWGSFSLRGTGLWRGGTGFSLWLSGTGFSLWLLAFVALAAPPAKVRPAAVAGSFYPAEPRALEKMLDGFLARAAAPIIPEPIVALVAPHAGYEYSGGVAAHAYAQLKGRKIERVVVISPSHFDGFTFSSVYDGDAYSTPLGAIPVDRDFASKLAAASPLIQLSSRGHTPAGGQGEHSLEVQLPFLQRVVGEFKLVPIVMGDQRYDACRALGTALAKLAPGPGTVIVASSDLSHFHTYSQAVQLDRKTLRAVEEFDHLSLSRNLEGRVWEACGGGPIVAAMIAAERLGATRARLLKYANSGDVTGDKGKVVGYGAVAFYKQSGAQGSAAPPFTLAERDRQELLRVAKQSVETAVKQGKLYDYSPAGFAALAQERGAFVTLKKQGKLRGCIGYPSPTKPLGLTVRDVAAMAAVQDLRFRPVTAAEIPELEFEVSVLSPLRRVTDINQIRVGRHGLVIRKGEREGLLLPQVAPEQGWDRAKYLEQICVKAGLPARAWEDPDADLFQFTALVFGDHERAAPPAASGPLRP